MATSGNNSIDSTTLGKKQRVGSTSHLSALAAEEPSSKRHRSATTPCYNDRATADVILRLLTESPTPPDEATPESCEIYLHSRVIGRSKYFATLLSDRWQGREENGSGTDSSSADGSPRIYRFTLNAAPTRESVNQRLMVLQLLYVYDDSDMLSAIDSVSTAIDLLLVALELLFEDCVRVCVRYLEAVPWTVEEEIRITNLIPYLNVTECDDLLARVTPLKPNLCEEMLEGLIALAIQNHHNSAYAKAFVSKLLRDFSSRDVARRVLGRAFKGSLSHIQQCVESYSSPDFRGDHCEMEAIQRMNLHSAMINGKHLLWLVERLVELKVADEALKTWSDQSVFISDLQRLFREDAWKNIAPSFP